MVDHITYRTDDATRWGPGWGGGDVPAALIDRNFWALFSAIQAMLDHQNVDGVISNISVFGGNMFVTLGDGTVFGPFTLPIAQWNFTGEWLPSTLYNPMDVFTSGGGLYMVLFRHVSAATFDPAANDGLGHNFYKLLLGPGPYDVAMYFPDFIPADGSILLMHVAARSFWLPKNLNLTGATSAAMLRRHAAGELTFPIYKNTTLIGAILFGGLESHGSTGPDVNADGSEYGTFVFPNAVQFAFRDRLLIYAPFVSAGPDATAAGLAATLAGMLGIFSS
jgi:hypothetical protein